MSKTFYAVQSVFGSNNKKVLSFTSKKERDNFVNTTDYADAITIKQLNNGNY